MLMGFGIKCSKGIVIRLEKYGFLEGLCINLGVV